MARIKTSSETLAADLNISKMLDQPGGFDKIASDILPRFIRQMRDYEAFGRKILPVEHVSSEELVIMDGVPMMSYAKDQNASAAYYAMDSMSPRYQVEGDDVKVGIVDIISDDHTIHVKRLKVQKYDYLERVRDLCAQAMSKSEDLRILELTEMMLQGDGTATAPEHIDQIVPSVSTSLQKNDMVALKKKLTRYDIPAGHYVMNPATLEDMFTWGFGREGSDIDQLTQRELLEQGVKYTLFGIPIVTSRIIPENIVYLYADPEYVGRMPILQDLTVELSKNAPRLNKGLFMYEFVGFYLASQLAVAKLVKGCTGENPTLIHKPSVDKVYARDLEIVGKIVDYGTLENDRMAKLSALQKAATTPDTP